jgi:serine/threonine protein phosphatase 1
VKKLFCFSDAHSFLTPLKTALEEAGFDPTNEDHWLVSCGDLFDRGDESNELFEYIMSIDRKILIRGNHDILLDECCAREFPYSHDNSNGTKKTICDLGGSSDGRSFAKCCCRTWERLAAYRDILVNYFETEKYIFVHSFIPLKVSYNGEGDCKPWYQYDKTYSYDEDWRNGNDVEWEEAMWGNPFKLVAEGLNKTGKTVVFGHWHSSYQWAADGVCSEFGDDAKFDPYIGENFIGLDTCTVYTGKVNVLVLEDNFIN